jgi:hypothetical protein
MDVSWDKMKKKWRAKCNGKRLGYHTTEEGAAHAYSTYLKDGVVPGPAVRAGWGVSQFKSVSWDKQHSRWRAKCKGKYLGFHTTEEAAAHACSKYLKDGIDPVEHRDANSSQFTGVSWHKHTNKWKVKCKGTRLGCHATEEDAARAYKKYLEDGIDPLEHPEANASHFKGVSWSKGTSKWRAQCKGKHLGYHATEEAAARAYNVEAERLGLPLNVITPAGAAGAGGAGAGAGPKRAGGARASAGAVPKRAALETSASPAPCKKMKL